MKTSSCKKWLRALSFALLVIFLGQTAAAQSNPGYNIPYCTPIGGAEIYTVVSFDDPQTFTLSIWFQTTTTSGGRLLGFGDSQSGTSIQFDRQIYMDNAGHINFGIYNSSFQVLTSPGTYNDGNWHNATATFSTDTGMNLYIDGGLVAANASYNGIQSYTGWWRMGVDTLGGWPNAPADAGINGNIVEVQIWDIVLSGAQIQQYLNRIRSGSEPGLISYWHLDYYVPDDYVTDLFETGDSTSTGNLAFTTVLATLIYPNGPISTAPLGPPGVANGTAVVSNNIALIKGSVLTDFQPTTVWCQYGATTGYGSVTPATLVAASNANWVNVSFPVGQLQEGVEYHYQLIATNTGGTNQTDDATFTIPTQAPSVATLSGLNATTNSILLTGLLTPYDPPVTFWFNYGSSTAYGSSSTAAVGDSALAFNGAAENYVAVPNAAVPAGPSPYTIEAWIYPGVMGNEGIIGWGIWGTENSVNSLRLDANGIRNDWWDNDLSLSVPTNLTGAWHHAAATFDGTNRTLYLDGVEVAHDKPEGLHLAPSIALQIGMTAGQNGAAAQPFNGTIDEVRIWNTNVSQQIIQQWMFQGVTTNHPDYSYLAAYWSMNAGFGTVVPDVSGHGNMGQFQGSPEWTFGQTEITNEVVGELVTDLPNGRSFHFQAAASDPTGGATGADALFQTIGIPGSPLITNPADNPDVDTCGLSAMVDPAGDETLAVFQWGTNISYGNLTAYQNVGAANAFEPVSVTLSNLAPGTTYHWQLAVFNSFGSFACADQTFTTLPMPSPGSPKIESPASSPLTGSAEVSVMANPVGIEAFVDFEWGATTTYGNSTAYEDIGSSFDYVPAATLLTNLVPNTTYHWRADAFSFEGPTYSADETFTTGAMPSFSGVTRSAGQIHIQCAGGAGANLMLFTSTNLRQWTSLTNVVVGGNGTAQISVPVNPGASQYFRLGTP